jgi:hypothetical protein
LFDKEGGIATALDGTTPFAHYFGNAIISGVKSRLKTIGSAMRFESSMESENGHRFHAFPETYRTTDLAILQSLVLRSRIVI